MIFILINGLSNGDWCLRPIERVKKRNKVKDNTIE